MTRRRAILGGAVLLALVGVFLAGRWSRPPQPASVIYREATEADRAFQAMVHTVVRTFAANSRTTADKSTTKTEYVWRWFPGGGVEARAVQVEAKDIETREESTSGEEEATDARQEATERIVETRSLDVRAELPRWSLGGLVGAQVAGEKAIDIRGPLVLGATLERRIFRSVWLGVWGTTSGAVGLSGRADL